MSINKLFQAAESAQPSFANPHLSGRIVNKFENGFLSGADFGMTSQATNALPMRPYQSNDGLGYKRASRQQASWARNYAFAPGLGRNARATKITNTTDAGLDPTSGVVAPVVNTGLDRIANGPIAPAMMDSIHNASAPVVITGAETANNTIEAMRNAGQKVLQKKRRV